MDEYYCVLTCGNKDCFEAEECPYYSLKDYKHSCDTIYAEKGLCSVFSDAKRNESCLD